VTNPTREAEVVARDWAERHAVCSDERGLVSAFIVNALAAVETLMAERDSARGGNEPLAWEVARRAMEAQELRKERDRLRATLDALRTGVEGIKMPKRHDHHACQFGECPACHSNQRMHSYNAGLAAVLTLLDRARDGE